jgi:thiol-disulfide isomerase/thioredoxin
MRQFSKKQIEKALKKIKAHLLELSIFEYLKSRNFELFCMEQDIDEIWDLLVTSYSQKTVMQGGSNFDRYHIPRFLKDDILGEFLTTLFTKKTTKFIDILPEFLYNYSIWCGKNKRYVPLEWEFVWKLRADCLDLGYDPENEVIACFNLVGFDADYFLMENSKKKNSGLEPPMLNENSVPIEIQESLARFKKDYPDSSKVAFIMMQFGKSQSHANILSEIRLALNYAKYEGVRADDRIYHDDKYYNILTYLHGCGFGIAVFEFIEEKSFNPNVSLELGYLLALNKNVCLLKETSLQTLPSDLVGKLYKEFDANSESDVYFELCDWLQNKGYAPTER